MAARLDSLLAIARLLAPTSKRVVAEVTQAVENPTEYFKALVDALTAAKALVEIDWKTAPDDLAWNLGKLGRKKETAWLSKIDPITDDRSTLELLEETGQKLLATHQLQLAALDIGSDSYCLVVAPAAAAKQLVALAKAARYGDVELFTGKGLAAAKRERLAREKRDRAEAAREAKRQAKVAERYKFFARGKETWSLIVHPRAVDTAYEAPNKKFYANHYFKEPNAPAALARKLIAGWNAEGFRQVDREMYTKLAIAETAYIGWVGPFPEHGHWLENKKIVRCLALEGNVVWTCGGTVGRSFAELQNYQHYKTPALAAKEHAAELARRNATSFYKPIERAALLKLYKR